MFHCLDATLLTEPRGVVFRSDRMPADDPFRTPNRLTLPKVPAQAAVRDHVGFIVVSEPHDLAHISISFLEHYSVSMNVQSDASPQECTRIGGYLFFSLMVWLMAKIRINPITSCLLHWFAYLLTIVDEACSNESRCFLVSRRDGGLE